MSAQLGAQHRGSECTWDAVPPLQASLPHCVWLCSQEPPLGEEHLALAGRPSPWLSDSRPQAPSAPKTQLRFLLPASGLCGSLLTAEGATITFQTFLYQSPEGSSPSEIPEDSSAGRSAPTGWGLVASGEVPGWAPQRLAHCTPASLQVPVSCRLDSKPRSDGASRPAPSARPTPTPRLC